MKIAILGGGFTGLTAALRLLQQGHQVTIFEKENEVGGLAVGFKNDTWEWSLEKAYHHWFTNDTAALNLAREMEHQVIIIRPQTDILINKQILPLDSPTSLLKFPYLSFYSRLRMGLALFYLKLVNNSPSLASQKALDWLYKAMGKAPVKLIWEPLLMGKFGKFAPEISLSWFWARIKKRTPSLAYPAGGFMGFAQKLESTIKKLDGEIFLNTTVQKVNSADTGCEVSYQTTGKSGTLKKPQSLKFDRVISTLPSPIFSKIVPGLPEDYIKRITSIPHLSALNLVLTLKEPFLKSSYWLNISDQQFPFLVLAEHTNFMDPKRYGNQHILYIGNYLPPDHPHLKMSAQELLKVFDPYLKQINPGYQRPINCQVFTAPFAQPVVTTDYEQKIPQFHSPIKNIYIANMDMVYPWDRGTNYAIEMGEKIAELVDQERRI